MLRYYFQSLVDYTINQNVRSIIELSSILGNDFEYRLDLGRRAGDDTQDFTRRSLLLKRFLEFLKQSHVLDRNHGLIGECFEKFDLRRSERTHLEATRGQHSNEIVLLTKGNGQMRVIYAA